MGYSCHCHLLVFKDNKRSDYILQNWMRSKATIEFLGLWEQINNIEFNSIEFDGIRNQAGLNSFTLSPNKWCEKTGVIKRSWGDEVFPYTFDDFRFWAIPLKILI